MKRILTLLAAVLLASLGLVGVTTVAASAHTPSITADCNGLVLDAQSYDGSKANTWTATVNGHTQSGTFGSSFHQVFAFPQDGTTSTYSGQIKAYDGSYDSGVVSGSVGPCGSTPPPPVTPPQPCKCPTLQVHGGRDLHCSGTYRGVQVHNVYVAKGRNCTILSSTITGNVKSTGAHLVHLQNTAIKGGVTLAGVRTTFIGTKDCAYDPFVGTSISVTGGHDVLICKQKVCHDIVVSGNDGRISLISNTARSIKVVNNKAYRLTGHPHHKNPGDIRVLRNKAYSFDTSGNVHRRVRKVGNTVL